MEDNKKRLKISLKTLIIIILLIIIAYLLFYIYTLENKRNCVAILNTVEETSVINENNDSTLPADETVLPKDENNQTLTENESSSDLTFKEVSAPIDINKIFGFICKGTSLEENDGQLLLINEDGSFIPILDLNTEAYSYSDGNLYFYKSSPDSAVFSVYDLKNNTEPKVLKIVPKHYSYIGPIEYYNGKIYYTADSYLYYLDIDTASVERMDEIDNYDFRIDKTSGTIYYTNGEQYLVSMNLKTGTIANINKTSVARYLEGETLIYESASVYYTYNTKTKKTDKLVDCYGGSVGFNEIASFKDGYLYLSERSELIYKTGETEEKLKTDESVSSFYILPNDKLLIYSTDEYDSFHNSYIYDFKTKSTTKLPDDYIYWNWKLEN